MIKEIFLPEIFNGRRVYSQRLIGFTIQDDTVSAAQILATPSSSYIEGITTESIIDADSTTAIKKILGRLKKSDQYRISIPSSLVIFKELTVPFLETDKIRMVLEYEVETMLPFSLSEALIDFIITKQDKKGKKSELLVASVREKDLQSI